MREASVRDIALEAVCLPCLPLPSAPAQATAIAGAGGSTGARLHKLAAVLPYLLPIGALLIWQYAARLGLMDQTILPTPLAVAAAGWHLIATGELFTHLGVSAARAFAGLIVGGAIGFGLGLVNGLSPLSARLTDTSLQMLRNIPHLSLIPLVILWFGIDEGAKLFLVALGVFFPIYLNTLHGIRQVDRQLIEMGKSYGLSSLCLFQTILLPGALPSILVGLRYALGIMWLTLVVAETIAAQSGLGFLANHGREFMRVDIVVFAILVYALLGKLADVITCRLERVFLPWNGAYQN